MLRNSSPTHPSTRHTVLHKLSVALIASMLSTVFALLPLQAHATFGEDYVKKLPATVYESTQKGPQTMDYDKKNKLFKAHLCWIKGKETHYYKFRIFSPRYYPDSFKKGPAAVNNHVFTMPMYFLTTTGDLSGLVEGQYPIIPYHTADGEKYSDFAQVYFVKVANNYKANKAKSVHDLKHVTKDLDDDVVASNIFVNAPLVPNGSRTEAVGGGISPIKPVSVWYKGQKAQVFFFETTNRGFADKFNPLTREGDAGQPNSGYEMTVSQFVEDKDNVSVAPVWMFNQYNFDVTHGVNSGGPSAKGQINIIDTDRLDADYSPVWQVWWVSKLPLGLRGSTVSDAKYVTPENGFKVKKTPMYVNCPNVGPHGGTPSKLPKTTDFTSSYQPGQQVTLHGSIVMKGGQELYAFSGNDQVGESKTNMMGAYSFTVDAGLLDQGVVVKDQTGKTIEVFKKPAPKKTPSPVVASPVQQTTPTQSLLVKAQQYLPQILLVILALIIIGFMNKKQK